MNRKVASVAFGLLVVSAIGYQAALVRERVSLLEDLTAAYEYNLSTLTHARTRLFQDRGGSETWRSIVAARQFRAAEEGMASAQARWSVAQAEYSPADWAVSIGISPTLTHPPGMPDYLKGTREVFFATDRRPTGVATFDEALATNGAMSYGRVIVAIPKGHEPGELERPCCFGWQVFSEDPSAHVTIGTPRLMMSRDALIEQLRMAIDQAADRSAFVFVHGHNVSFDNALLRAGQLAFDLKFKGPAVVYSWPGAEGVLTEYPSNVEVLDWTVPHAREFLDRLRRETGARTIHLIAHSMGARVLARALEGLKAAPQDPLPRFQEVVLAAPDIDSRVFPQLAAAIRSRSDRVTVYASSKDIALGVSALFRGGLSRAGRVAADVSDVDVIDASTAWSSITSLFHSEFAENPRLLNDIALLLRQRLSPDNRSVMLERDGGHWRLR